MKFSCVLSKDVICLAAKCSQKQIGWFADCGLEDIKQYRNLHVKINAANINTIVVLSGFECAIP